jgi:hypothetical protein
VADAGQYHIIPDRGESNKEYVEDLDQSFPTPFLSLSKQPPCLWCKGATSADACRLYAYTCNYKSRAEREIESMAVMETQIVMMKPYSSTYLLPYLYAGRYPRAKSPMCKTNLKEPEEPHFTS